MKQLNTEGNTWADQDDALFGAKSSPPKKGGIPVPAETLCRPCAPQPQPTRGNGGRNGGGGGGSGLGLNNAMRRLSTTIQTATRVTLPPRRNTPAAAAAINRSSARPTIPARRLPASTTTTTTSDFLNSFSRNISNAVISHRCLHCHSFPSSYKYHPYFPSERICATHSEDSIIKCSSCRRYQPRNIEYVPLDGDRSRSLCPACVSSAVLLEDDCKVIYGRVLDFLEDVLNLTVWDGLRPIPIHLVDYGTLNSASGGDSFHTRGLCLWESQSFLAFPGMGSFLSQFHPNPRSTQSTRQGVTRQSVSVTAILVLKGLPSNLTGSILAHEATHAWFRLHQDCGNRNGERMEPKVEEGCCNLVAYLYLNHLIELQQQNSQPGNVSKAGADGDNTTEHRMQQYFRNCIETDTSEVYGDGFRLAAKAYSDYGLQGLGIVELLNYVANHHSFPPSL